MDYLESGTEVWVYDQAVVLNGVIECRHVGFQGEAYYVNAKQGTAMVRKLVFRDSIFVKTTDREKLLTEIQNSITYLQIMMKKVEAV